MKLSPLGQFVVVKPIKAKQTEGGILLPSTSDSEIVNGEVVEVGPDAQFVKVGDAVIFMSYSGKKVDNHLVVKEEDIYCKVKDESNKE